MEILTTHHSWVDRVVGMQANGQSKRTYWRGLKSEIFPHNLKAFERFSIPYFTGHKEQSSDPFATSPTSLLCLTVSCRAVHECMYFLPSFASLPTYDSHLIRVFSVATSVPQASPCISPTAKSYETSSWWLPTGRRITGKSTPARTHNLSLHLMPNLATPVYPVSVRNREAKDRFSMQSWKPPLLVAGCFISGSWWSGGCHPMGPSMKMNLLLAQDARSRQRWTK